MKQVKRVPGIVIWMHLAAVAAALIWAGPLLDARAEPRGAPAPVARQVTLVMDYGEGVEKRWKALPWIEEMTVEGALKHAAGLEGPRALQIQASGQGERFFVKSLDGLANEGAGKNARNWIFFVNGEMGKASAGVAAVNAGDTIEWRYTSHDWSETR